LNRYIIVNSEFIESVFDNRAPGRKCHLYIQNIAPQQGPPTWGSKICPIKKIKQREATETVQQCRKIQHSFLTHYGFYPLKKGAPSQLKLDFGQVAPIVR